MRPATTQRAAAGRASRSRAASAGERGTGAVYSAAAGARGGPDRAPGVVWCRAMDRTERLLDLVATLLDASEPVPFARIRELFPDYGEGSAEANERKFERDKAELA